MLQSVYLSTLFYGSVSWTMRHKQESRSSSTEIKFLNKVLDKIRRQYQESIHKGRDGDYVNSGVGRKKGPWMVC